MVVFQKILLSSWTLILRALSRSRQIQFQSLCTTPSSYQVCFSDRYYSTGGHVIVARPWLEPGTPTLKVWCSTNWASGPFEWCSIINGTFSTRYKAVPSLSLCYIYLVWDMTCITQFSSNFSIEWKLILWIIGWEERDSNPPTAIPIRQFYNAEQIYSLLPLSSQLLLIRYMIKIFPIFKSFIYRILS